MPHLTIAAAAAAGATAATTTSKFLLNKQTYCRQLILPLSQHKSSRRSFHMRPNTGLWPEPIKQQTLAQFLHEINYFEEPRKFINIGLETGQPTLDRTKSINHQDRQSPKNKSSNFQDGEPDLETPIGEKKVDVLLKKLSVDAAIPTPNFDDFLVNSKQLVELAISAGIYRDLFTNYQPNRDHIYFTQEQAQNLDQFVPPYWITDMPFARAKRKLEEQQPLPYFEPIVGISARFVTADDTNQDEISAQTAYHGNIIPASEALVKPSITLDGKLIGMNPRDLNFNHYEPKKYNNWNPGSIESLNFSDTKKFYSVVLVNLDYIHENMCNLHWMVADIQPGDKNSKSSEICDYLPVHGIQGFGYSRYVFIVFQHDSPIGNNETKISDFVMEKRKFDANSFLSRHKDTNLKPVGLSWFQTTWDITSNGIFHNYLNQKVPVFEHVQMQDAKAPERSYAPRTAFNIFLDYYREKKSINEQVLLERLKSVNPTEYKDQYVPPKVPPTVFEDKGLPHWMHNVMFKKKSKLGYWRGLRPASKLLPLDNNADLDHPVRPIPNASKHPPGLPNIYNMGVTIRRPHIVIDYRKPINEFESIQCSDNNFLDLDTLKKSVVDKAKTEKIKKK